MATFDVAGEVLTRLAQDGATLATAESLTGGLLGSTITSVPGASASYVGGVVTYATALKVSVLGVPESLVSSFGVVSAECASAMAAGARELTGATYALSTTGVAGPDEQEGKPAGTVYVALAGPALDRVLELTLAGDRAAIRTQTCEAALTLLLETLCPDDQSTDREETRLG